MRRVIEEIRELKADREKVDYEKLAAAIGKVHEAAQAEAVKSLGSFRTYFLDIKKLLETKAANADEKASILLDRGIAYTKFGIAFYLVSIVAWHSIAFWKGMSGQIYLGFASCSLLFIFIEFLSAWFLKQYRHFVDTSTYIVKVKAIFDRYMLVFLSTDELCSDPTHRQKALAAMQKLLGANIRWPDAYMWKKPDVSFALEAIDALGSIATALKEGTKARKSRSRSSASGRMNGAGDE